MDIRIVLLEMCQQPDAYDRLIQAFCEKRITPQQFLDIWTSEEDLNFDLEQIYDCIVFKTGDNSGIRASYATAITRFHESCRDPNDCLLSSVNNHRFAMQIKTPTLLGKRVLPV